MFPLSKYLTSYPKKFVKWKQDKKNMIVVVLPHLVAVEKTLLATIDISKCVVNAPLYVMYVQLHGYKVKEAFWVFDRSTV